MTDQDTRSSRMRKLSNRLGLVILLATFGWSLVHVTGQAFFRGESAVGGGKKVIVFAHWQLEGRTVEAIEWAAEQYTQLHPDVQIEQIAIPTNAYDQWVRTQLIGRTAPDMIEMWEREDWDTLAVRYFLPLADIVDKPNPYNAGTDLADTPLRKTYIDGMRGGFRLPLQEYYCIPLSIFTTRIYANRDLLDQVAQHAGIDRFTPPRTLTEFMALCEDVKAYASNVGEKIVPIAGSDSIATQFRLKYFSMGVAGLNDRLDIDLDGDISAGVALEAMFTGKLDIRSDPNLRAAHTVQYDICRHFNQGFMGVKRDQSISLFAQGKAAMIATGSWEAGSLYRQIGDDFKITVFDFPVAAPENPQYGRFLNARVSEASTKSGFPMGITRFSKHRQVALDFLHFLTSREMNEKINRRFRWFPAIEGAATDEVLEAFRPQVDGVYAAFLFPHLHPGPQSQLSYEQKLAAYLSEDEPLPAEYAQFVAAADRNGDRDRETFLAKYGPLGRDYLAKRQGGEAYDYAVFIQDWRNLHYQQFIDSYEADFRRLAFDDFLLKWEQQHRTVVQSETALAHARTRAIRAGAVDAPPAAIRTNLQALVHGQVARTMERADGKMRYDRLKAAAETGGEGRP